MNAESIIKRFQLIFISAEYKRKFDEMEKKLGEAEKGLKKFKSDHNYNNTMIEKTTETSIPNDKNSSLVNELENKVKEKNEKISKLNSELLIYKNREGNVNELNVKFEKAQKDIITLENEKKQMLADNNPQKAANEYKTLNDKYNVCKQKLNSKKDEVEELKKNFDSQKKKYETLKSNFHASLENETKAKIAEEMKKLKIAAYTDINTSYKNDLELTKNKLTLVSGVLPNVKKELRSLRAAQKDCHTFAGCLQELIRLDFEKLKEKCKTLSACADDDISYRKKLQISFDAMLPYIAKVVPQAANLIERFKKVEEENDRLRTMLSESQQPHKKEEVNDIDDPIVTNSTNVALLEILQAENSLMKKQLQYTEDVTVNKQNLALDLERELEDERNKRCSIEFEVCFSNSELNLNLIVFYLQLNEEIKQLKEELVKAEERFKRIEELIRPTDGKK